MPITREIRSEARLRLVSRDLGSLTAAERLFIWRHRRRGVHAVGRNGTAMSQREAAAALGIDYGAYNRLENGARTRLSVENVEALLSALGPLDPTPGELCFIARRRSGHLLKQLEVEAGVSRPKFHQLERAGDGKIVRLWRARGFRFPGTRRGA